MDSPPLLVDNFEPVGLILPLLQQSIPAENIDLNLKGYADYFWTAEDGHTIQAERKQGGELLGNIDGVEAQLKKQYDKAQENILIIEGFVIPTTNGCTTLRVSKDSNVWYRDREYKGQSYAGYQGWLYQLDKVGITHYNTANVHGTAMLLVALYKNSQKPEHKTLQRYIKPKIFIEVENRHIKTLMGIEGIQLGEKKATALIDRFTTTWGVMIQDVESLIEVEGIGRKLAERLHWAIGRRQ